MVTLLPKKTFSMGLAIEVPHEKGLSLFCTLAEVVASSTSGQMVQYLIGWQKCFCSMFVLFQCVFYFACLTCFDIECSKLLFFALYNDKDMK